MSRRENKGNKGSSGNNAKLEVAQQKLDAATKALEAAKASNSSEEIQNATLEHAEWRVKLLKAQHVDKEEVKTAVLAFRALRHPEEKQAVPVPKQASLRGDLIRLSSIPEHWLVVSHMLEEKLSKDLEGPVYALQATLTLLKEIYFLENPDWKLVRDKVSIGLIKDTKQHGNTSVSMGAAKTAPAFETYVGFLNCGTGGGKYQMYSNKGCLHLEAEAKPKGGASPNALQVGTYSPATAVSFEETRKLLEEELKNAPWKDIENVPVYAFVTGTIRQAWEDAAENDKAVLEGEMQRLFDGLGIKALGDSFFMPQDDEGKFELLGTQAMYTNLVEAGSLDKGTKVIASFGIGRGSCQWMVQEVSEQLDLIPHRAGMTKPLEMSKVSETVVNAYRNPARLKALIEALSTCAQPVIALKSGCALLMEMKEFPHIKQQLVAPVSQPGELVRLKVAKNGDRCEPVELAWPRGSIDRLCAAAGVVLGAPELVRVFRQNGATVTDVATVQSGETLIFSRRTETYSPKKYFKPVVDVDAHRLQQWAKLGRPVDQAPASEVPGVVVTGGLGWGTQRVNEKATAQYDEVVSAIAKFGGDAVYLYPRYALHTTVATLGSFKGTSPLRVASPEELGVIRETWCRVLKVIFEPLLAAGPITLVAEKLQLSEGAGIILFSDPENRFAEFRSKLKEALQILLQDSSILALRTEVRNAMCTAFHIPNIIHSTFLRFAHDNLQDGTWDDFEVKFAALAQGWQPATVQIDQLSLVEELVPFMHSLLPLQDNSQQHHFWLNSSASSSSVSQNRQVGLSGNGEEKEVNSKTQENQPQEQVTRPASGARSGAASGELQAGSGASGARSESWALRFGLVVTVALVAGLWKLKTRR